ncbi:hypothetical protein ACHAWF_000310 [Thalassiosira exigua]
MGWVIANPPSGQMQNIKSPSREAEILARQKIFKLVFKWYLEDEAPKLLMPRFLVPKVVENGIVLDPRCVWDSSTNGCNRCYWTSSFMLPNSQDAEWIVVKWLSTSLRQYLQLGSPDEDYTQNSETFIKSKQGDIGVGEQFSNFQAHKNDRSFLGVCYIRTNGVPGVKEEEMFYRSNRLTFGHTTSPYIAIQGQSRITEIQRETPLTSPTLGTFQRWC